MDKDIIRIDFKAKQVVEGPIYTEDEVYEAIAVLRGFFKDNLKQKGLDISNALQILDHDLEDMSDDEIEGCDALLILKRRRALRKKRRNIKDMEKLQDKLKKTITIGMINTVDSVTNQHSDSTELGSCDKFFKGSINRKTLSNKLMLKHSRIRSTVDN